MITPIDLGKYRDHLQVRLHERSVPEHLHRGLLAYFTERRPVGRFLQACLENDLSTAVMNADAASCLAIKGIAEFLHWHVPGTAWGSPSIVRAWLESTDPVPIIFD